MSNEKIDYNSNYKYNSISPDERNIIINNINTIENYERDITNRQATWWKTKHYPEADIPTKIYLIGSGTFNELYNKYVIKYGNVIDEKEFKNYVRELIYQKILK